MRDCTTGIPLRPCFALVLACILALALGAGSCVQTDREEQSQGQMEKRWAMEREGMVKNQIEKRGVRNRGVLDALRKVERHRFVPKSQRAYSYNDYPLPIGKGQTISQPYIVALMTELLDPKPEHKTLEIGTGSGYQAAILGEIVDEVYTIEIVEDLGESAKALLEELGYKNVHVRIGDGYKGWPEEAPFDGIIVTAAPENVPQPLIDQLKVGGKLVIPVGKSYSQYLKVLEKTRDGRVKTINSIGVRFVPMTGEAMGKKK